MNFEVKRFAGYKELILSEGSWQSESGFLDQEGSRAMAAKLISAAEDLLWNDMSVAQFIGVEEVE